MNIDDSVLGYLREAPTSGFVQQEVALLDHWQGADNLLWRVDSPGGEAVLKLYLDAGQARSRRQFDGHAAFAPSGLAPEALWVDRYPEGLSRQVLVYRWLPGEALDLAREQDRSALAQAVGQVHASDPNAVRSLLSAPGQSGHLLASVVGQHRQIGPETVGSRASSGHVPGLCEAGRCGREHSP
ncbi:MAG: phosphotransferase [Caldilineaceae bacterium]|nr:phosphotransferase [Caldilineaceae bacterium]